MPFELILDPREENGHRSGVHDLHLDLLRVIGGDQGDLDHPEQRWKQDFRKTFKMNAIRLCTRTVVYV